jgi:hypothetical protein
MHLVLVFTVAVGLYVLGMIVLALAAILGIVRGNGGLKKLRPEARPGDYWFQELNSSGSLAILLAILRASSRLSGLVRSGPETEQHQGNDNER